jgi:hypothetical protein
MKVTDVGKRLERLSNWGFQPGKTSDRFFCDASEPSHVPAKFLFGMRREAASPALASLDKPEILQQMRQSFAQSPF